MVFSLSLTVLAGLVSFAFLLGLASPLLVLLYFIIKAQVN